jgi:predicted O-methyltransferase YrrM
LGLATIALSLGSKNSKIITLEGCLQTISIAKNQCQLQNLNNIEFINTKFEDYLKKLQPATRNPQLIYFDGNHSKKATLDYFELLLPIISNESVWIFDDIHWSKDMEEAWEIIKNNPKVTVTIDTFQWGFVFFRKEQEKEHFVIRV